MPSVCQRNKSQQNCWKKKKRVVNLCWVANKSFDWLHFCLKKEEKRSQEYIHRPFCLCIDWTWNLHRRQRHVCWADPHGDYFKFYLMTTITTKANIMYLPGTSHTNDSALWCARRYFPFRDKLDTRQKGGGTKGIRSTFMTQLKSNTSYIWRVFKKLHCKL